MQLLAAEQLDHGVLHVLPLLLDVVVGEVVAALAKAVIAPAVLKHVVANGRHGRCAGRADAVTVIAGVGRGVVGGRIDAVRIVGDDGLFRLVEGFPRQLFLLQGRQLWKYGDAVWMGQWGRYGLWPGGMPPWFGALCIAVCRRLLLCLGVLFGIQGWYRYSSNVALRIFACQSLLCIGCRQSLRLAIVIVVRL